MLFRVFGLTRSISAALELVRYSPTTARDLLTRRTETKRSGERPLASGHSIRKLTDTIALFLRNCQIPQSPTRQSFRRRLKTTTSSSWATNMTRNAPLLSARSFFYQQAQARKPDLSGLLRDLKMLSDLSDQVPSRQSLEYHRCGSSVTLSNPAGQRNDVAARHQQRSANVTGLPFHPVIFGSGHNGVAMADP